MYRKMLVTLQVFHSKMGWISAREPGEPVAEQTRLG